MELQGNIRVQCRIRPVLPSDVARGGSDAPLVDAVDSCTARVTLRPDEVRTFEFDHVHGPDSSNADVAQELVGMITSFVDG